MEKEWITYRTNLEDFLKCISDSQVEQLIYDIYENPEFDKGSLPFNFNYSHSVIFITDKGRFKVLTSLTSEGFETFWVTPALEAETFSGKKLINSKVKSFEIKNGHNNYAFKIAIEFDHFSLFLFSADIYPTTTGVFEYKKNDEMILVFDNKAEADIFENLVN